MPNFGDSLKKKLEESVGYQFGSLANQDLPLEIVSFPPVASGSPQSIDPVSPVVTSGETLPYGAPRADKEAESGLKNKQSDQDVVAEVGSLLITIGHILQTAGLVTDKYDSQGVLNFINQNYVNAGHPTEDVSCSQAGIQPVMPYGAAYLQERKLLEESKKA